MDELSIEKYYEPIKQAQAENNAWSAAQAQKAMDYQTYMSNTAHQREVADLKAAGLNPILSAGGTGATTSSGVAASAGQENITAMYGLMSKALQATIDQSQAMQNTAKYIASASSGSSFSSSSDNLSSDNPILKVLKDVLKRKFGIQGETVDAVINSIPKSVQEAGDVLESFAKSGTTAGNLFNAKVNYEKQKRDEFMKLADKISLGVKNLLGKIKFGKSFGTGSKYYSDTHSSGRGGKFNRVKLK